LSARTEDQGVARATSPGGIELPVIDVTHPSFALPADARAIAALLDAYAAAERRQARIPGFARRWMLAMGARRSLLLRKLIHPESDFLDGLTTYVMKLGAANLPAPFNSDVDRRLAATPHAMSMRLRLQQCAKLLADGLAPHLALASGAPLLLVNIGGGPAIDSINALILLHRSRPELLARPIEIKVFDVDAAGPAFGARALSALRAEGRALAGVDIRFSHESYDWNAPALLGDRVREASARGAVIAASSEGALFEYGSDSAIVTNLAALRGGGHGAMLVVGSVTRADMRKIPATTPRGYALVPRGIGGFTPLAQRGGFALARSEAAPLSDQVLLVPI
jgi:hypothetical protein